MLRKLLFHPALPPGVLSLITSAVYGAYLVTEGRLSPMAEYLLSLSWLWTIVLWMDLDTRQRRQIPCFEFSFLAAVTYPVSVLWYCVWSRGWRGLLIVLGLVGLMYFLPWMIAVVLWIALRILA